jgi:hypothetical protein
MTLITEGLINEYKNRLESKIYLNYIEEFKSYLSFKETIIDEEYKNNTTSYYKENNNKYEIYIENKIHMIINKPVYSNIWNKINQLKNNKYLLLIDYEILIRKNLYTSALHQTALEDDLNVNKIIEKLSDIDKNIQDLYEYYLIVNNFDQKISDNLAEIKTIIDHRTELYNNILNEIDYKSKRNLIKSYLEMYSQTNNKYEDLLNNINYYYTNDGINFIIEELPHIHIIKQTKETKEARKKEVVKKNTEKIELKIKNVLKNQFKFRNLKECKSKKKSALYFMTKEDIIEIIENNKELKSQMPENYINKEKQTICEILAEKKYITEAS